MTRSLLTFAGYHCIEYEGMRSHRGGMIAVDELERTREEAGIAP